MVAWCRIVKVYKGTRSGLTRVIGSWVVVDFVTGVRPDFNIRKYVCFGPTTIGEAIGRWETDLKNALLQA